MPILNGFPQGGGSPCPYELLASYTTAGSRTWTVPAGVTEIMVAMIGGGAAGGAAQARDGAANSSAAACGGAAGYARTFTMNVTPGQSFSVVVGAGGQPGMLTSTGGIKGSPGGSTSFAGETVNGGNVGEAGFDENHYYNGAPGGQASNASSGFASPNTPFGMTPTEFYSNKTATGASIWDIIHLFALPPEEWPFWVAAGGMAKRPSNGSYSGQAAVTLPNGNKSSGGVGKPVSTEARAVKGTDPGCGGGAAAGAQSGSSFTRYVYAAPGCDGGVFIYKKSGNRIW